MNEEKRLKTLLYNAISLLIDETFERYAEEDREAEWLDMMTTELGCSVGELELYGGIDLKVLKGE